MDVINGNTTELRQKMVDAGVPNIGVTYGTSDGTGHYIGDYQVNHNQIASNKQNNQVVSNKVDDFVSTYGGDYIAKSSRGVTIDNTAQALNHYLFGDGSPVTIGPKTISATLNHPDFALGHYLVMNNKLNKKHFSVDMTWNVFHVGDTRVRFSINEENRNITYTLFDGDSFSDADFFDEFFLGKKLGEPAFQSDGLGPKLERLGGTPFNYIPFSITFSY